MYWVGLNKEIGESRDQLHQDIRPYWSFRDDMAVIDSVIMKGRHIIIPEVLQQQALDQLHMNHMGIEKKNKITSEGLKIFSRT